MDKLHIISAATAGVIAAIMILNRRKPKSSRVRKMWSKIWLTRRNEGHGVLNMLDMELRQDDPESYKRFIRMCSSQFDELLMLIQNDISKQDTHLRECISPAQRLGITLRFLATGESYRSLMFASRIHESTLSIIIPEVCNAIVNKLQSQHIKMPSTESEWMDIASDFDRLWNFPLCLGAIDGKHINFRPPRSSGSYYYNYKGAHSIVLLAVVDANYKFIYIDVGVNGRMSDGGVYRESTLKQGIERQLLNFPPDKKLPGQTELVGYTFIADEAFPLSQRIMKPYAARGLTNEKRIFNYRLSRARRVVENAFGILANRFRVLLNTINLSPDKVELITRTCCVLHNFLCTKNNKYKDLDCDNKLSRLIEKQGRNRACSEALSRRESFTQYFTSAVGRIYFQDKYSN